MISVKVNDLKGFNQDVKRSLRSMRGKVTLTREVGRDPGAMRVIRAEVAEQNARLWATQGRAAGEPWRSFIDKAVLDLVHTGAMRQNMTSAGAMLARVGAKSIAFRPQVRYWRYQRRAYRWVRGAHERIRIAVLKYIAAQR